MPPPRPVAFLLPLALACGPAAAQDPPGGGFALAECRVTDTDKAAQEDATSAYAVEFGDTRVKLLLIRPKDGRSLSVDLTPSPILSTVSYRFAIRSRGLHAGSVFMQVWDLGDGRVGVERFDISEDAGTVNPPRYSMVGLRCPSSLRKAPNPPPAPSE